MAKVRRKKTDFKKSPLQVALLLVKILLVRLGQIPISALKAVKFFLKRAKNELKPPELNLPKLSYPKLPFPKFRRRGRPPKDPFLIFYLHKITGFLKIKVPRSVKTVALSLAVLMVFITYTLVILEAAYQLPSPQRLASLDQPLTTQIYDRNGKLLDRLYEGRNRTLVNLDELPSFLTQATIAIEDKNFYHHIGVDPMAILRAFYHNYQNNTLEGASTLTQQLVKNSLLSAEKTYSRKLKEIILALWTEVKYSKWDILQMYLSNAPYGGPAWGVEAAALTYFGKNAKDLDLSESAFLAGLPASPTEFSPYGTKPELGKLRQKQVLKRMQEDGYITKKQAEEAEKKQLKFQPLANNIQAPHFVMFVRDYLSKKYGARVVSQGGLKVYTSLDLDLQEGVQKIVKEEVDNLANLNVQNGAAMVLDAKTGQILAMVGSKDYHQSDFGNFNVATSNRQPGSSIKPITYATAFKKGYNPGNTVLDIPTIFSDEWGNSYQPQNYDGKFHGPISIRVALGSSYNVPAVRTLGVIGLDAMIETAKDLGITTLTDPKRYGLALTLGAGEVKMIEMMGVYASFSQNGTFRPPNGILKVVDATGQVLEEYEDHPQQALQPEIAYLITNVLADNDARTPAFGANSLLNIKDQYVAVKTGTSDNKRDNWTFGYTSDFVIGVWVGNNDNSPMNPALTSGITGAAPIWNKIIKGMLAKHPSKPFERPAGVIDVLVDGRKDIAVAGILPKQLVRIKNEKDKSTYFDIFSSYATSSAQAAIEEGNKN